MFWVARFFLFWFIFVLIADKRRWRELFTAGIFAGFLGSSTDDVMHHFHLWIYDYMQTTFLADITDDWSVYIVVAYLFIQFLPKTRTFRNMIIYWLIWTTITITIEFIHILSGHMSYNSWWNLGLSYLCDWVLFYVFYKFHQIFKLEKLSA